MVNALKVEALNCGAADRQIRYSAAETR